jgi:hypothetical protein
MCVCYNMSKETHYSVKRDLLQCQKRPTGPIYVCMLQYVKRDPLQCQKRPITVSKETYWSYICVYVTICAGPLFASKRDPLECQKRPIRVSKETH